MTATGKPGCGAEAARLAGTCRRVRTQPRMTRRLRYVTARLRAHLRTTEHGSTMSERSESHSAPPSSSDDTHSWHPVCCRRRWRAAAKERAVSDDPANGA